jgi:serine/threonine-protein kinase RsbW
VTAVQAKIDLRLSSEPGCVTVVRGMLGGVGEALALGPELLNDVKTAVSEACNNVVMHAYPNGPGPLRAQVRALADLLEVTVSDRGLGMGRVAAADEHMGLGIAVISALADRVEFDHTAGGTRVRMSFARRGEGRSTSGALGGAAPGCASGGASGARLSALAPGAERDAAPLLDGDVQVLLAPPSLLTAVLGRTVRALAAASFSLDRFSDLYLITDELGAHIGALAAGDELAFALSARPGALQLALAPLRRGSGARLDGARDGSLPLARLLDWLQVGPWGDGDSEILRAQVSNR